MPLPNLFNLFNLRSRAIVPAKLAILFTCLLALSFAAPAGATSKVVPAKLRVVDATGRTLTEQTQYTGPTTFVTDPAATCFGAGTGGSGASVKVGMPTALGMLADAGDTDRDVRPLSLTDAFDFGLGLCGIGKAVAPESGFWFLKKNHVASQTGGDQTQVQASDEILWFLITDFNAPSPDELVLSAPSRVKSGSDIPVRVVSYADDGNKTPAAGVTVAGAATPTDAAGKTTVPVTDDLIRLAGTRAGSIPSNNVAVCTVAAAKCPAGYAQTLAGGERKDRISVGPIASRVLSGGGDDSITATLGSFGDVIKCGAGDDTLNVSRRIAKRSKISGCERIKKSS